MQKILNDPLAFVDEMLDGVVLAHADQLRILDGSRGIVRVAAPVANKVGIATGGGSGHLPVFMGYVGEGLADGAAIGNVFASPSAEQMLDVTRAVNGGAGVLYIYGNYGGDVMNFDLAAELAEAEGISVATVLGADDVASAPRGEEARRRGIAGIFFLYKVGGAAAARGASLAEVAAVTARAAANVRSMGVALAPCTLPAAGVPTFDLPAGEMEIGMGIHGEPGVRRGALESADRIAEQLTTAILDDLPFSRQRRSRRAGQRTGCDTARGAVHPVSRRAPDPAGARRRGPPRLGRRIRNVTRNGRRVAVVVAPGRRVEGARRCARRNALLCAAVSTVLELLQAVAADVADATSELNRLDAVAGDGDLGATMATASAALQALLPELEGEPLAGVCRRCGSELARKAPSTSGTLLATAFLRAGAAAGAPQRRRVRGWIARASCSGGTAGNPGSRQGQARRQDDARCARTRRGGTAGGGCKRRTGHARRRSRGGQRCHRGSAGHSGHARDGRSRWVVGRPLGGPSGCGRVSCRTDLRFLSAASRTLAAPLLHRRSP